MELENLLLKASRNQWIVGMLNEEIRIYGSAMFQEKLEHVDEIEPPTGHQCWTFIPNECDRVALSQQ
jgi:hypothetical protein